MKDFENGYAVGKMYASAPVWWLGFWWGQIIGSYKKIITDSDENG